MTEADPCVIVIDNLAFPCGAPSDSKDPKHRHAENLHLNGPQMLEDARFNWCRVSIQSVYQPTLKRNGITTWQSFMMFMLPHVAKHYGVERHELLKAWMANYGYRLAFPG